MLDYPRVFVHRVEILPIPEVIDTWSEEAVRATLPRDVSVTPQTFQSALARSGISRTQEVAIAYESEAIKAYFQTLESRSGQELSPTELTPALEPDRYFRWAYAIPGTKLYLGLSDTAPVGGARVCEVMFYGRGPNFGSAGGPTLVKFGAVATIRYEGRLLG